MAHASRGPSTLARPDVPSDAAVATVEPPTAPSDSIDPTVPIPPPRSSSASTVARLQTLWRIATSRERSDEEKMQLMLHLALDTLRMEVVMVAELTDGCLVVRQVSDRLGLFHIGLRFACNDALLELAVRSRVSHVIPDLAARSELRDHPLVQELGLRVLAGVQIWMGEQHYGTMIFLRRTPVPGGVSDEDRTFMDLVAAWFGQFLLQERNRETLERLAMTDALTGLMNRRGAETRLADELDAAHRNGQAFAIAICDLDRFKLINDLYGHDLGDSVLRSVTGAMSSLLRDGDWLARWGGEEFLVFLRGVESAPAFEAMEQVRQQIRTRPIETVHGPLEITMSIGIATYRHVEETVGSLLTEADGCLYEAKRAGRDRVVASDPSRRGILWRAGMLQHALREQRVVPAYQKIVDLRTREVVANEAMARLITPDGRVLPASEFIEAAEGINLIHEIDWLIARHSMDRCALASPEGAARPVMHFINLSAQFLARKELVAKLLSEAEHCCRRTNVVFEITERQFIGDMNDVLRHLQPLLDFGLRLALDDFGSGYSSFLYLAQLPISFLKIEGWMVANLQTNARIGNMIQSIVWLARHQGITTIAECVEDEETARRLKVMGVEWAQGNYFGPPECEERALPIQ